MSLEVLQNEGQVEAARSRLEERGVSCLGMPLAPPKALLERLRFWHPPALIGDRLKSWDVLRTAEHLEATLARDGRVLDIGAFSSEILCVLHRMGFTRLAGLDLNPGVRRMPFAGVIRYEVGDFLEAPFPDGSFDAVTSISVIEHGFDARRLLASMARLIAPGGQLVASFDYWPDKIDTRDTDFFGMSWRIFSRDEVQAFIEDASAFGFAPAGPLAFEASQRPVHCAGRAYTFAWLALRRIG